MKRTTEWRLFNNGGERIRAKYGFDKHGDQEPYFAVGGEIEGFNGAVWENHSCGCLHDQIAEHFPELAGVIRWHLCTESTGPMHYVANAVHRWSLHCQQTGKIPLAEKEWQRPGKNDPDQIEAFKSHVVFGAVEGDKLPELPKKGEPTVAAKVSPWDPDVLEEAPEPQWDIRAWCEARLPALLEAMRSDIAAIDHEAMLPKDGASLDGWQEFVSKLGIKIRCRYVDEQRDGRKLYEVTLSRVEAGEKFSLKTNFTQGSAWREPPKAHDVLQCIVSDARSGHSDYEEFCNELGESTDSISTKNLWKACVRSAKKLHAFIGDERFERLVAGY
jgi:hypothetical protein